MPQQQNLHALFLGVFSLLSCMIIVNACDDLECLNGGSCYQEKDGSIVNEFCLCPAEFEGERCQIKKVCNLSCVFGKCKFPYVPPSARNDAEVDSKPYCFCQKGYSGVYCESPDVTCPDGKHTCYNGAKCEEIFHPDGRAFFTPKYKCNCEGAGDKKNPYAGLNCHIPAEKVCSLLTDVTKSFCVNGGTCKDMTMVEGAHFGCNCPENFEGEHCEFLKDSDPVTQAVEEEKTMLGANKNKSENTQESPEATSALKDITIIIIVVGICSVYWIVTTTRSIHRKRRALHEAATAYIDDDVTFDADGNRMTNIIIGDDDNSDDEGKIV